MGDGSADFLEKDLVEALKDLKDERCGRNSTRADKRRRAEMRGFVKFLKEEKLPKATSRVRAGPGQFRQDAARRGTDHAIAGGNIGNRPGGIATGTGAVCGNSRQDRSHA